MPRGSFADADGVRIHCLDHGGDGAPLVLVHATGFHGRVWDPLVPALRERSHVYAIDQRGHGLSDKPPAGYDWNLFGSDVLAAVDHLGLEAPIGMGHSAGGAALILAEASRPGTFSRLILCDPVLAPRRWREEVGETRPNPMAEAALKRRAVWDSREQMIERLRDGTPLQTWRDEFLEAYVEHGTEPTEDGRFALRCPPEVEAQVYRMSLRHAGWEQLAELACPVLFLAGERSDLWWEERRASAAEQLADGRVEVVADAGHFFPMEDPQGTLRAVTAFIDEA